MFRMSKNKKKKGKEKPKEVEKEKREVEVPKKQLSSLRVMQKTLVYVIGIPLKIATEEVRPFSSPSFTFVFYFDFYIFFFSFFLVGMIPPLVGNLFFRCLITFPPSSLYLWDNCGFLDLEIDVVFWSVWENCQNHCEQAECAHFLTTAW